MPYRGKATIALLLVCASGPALCSVNLEGTWQPRRFTPLIESAVGTSGVLKTVEGELPPFSADAQNAVWHRIDMEQRGTPVANTQDTCRPRLPQAMLNLFLGPFHVMQTADRIVFFFEADGDLPWTVYLNRKHPKTMRPTYFGDSVGRWEGDTLIIDTAGLNDLTWLDGQGSPHSEQARLVTRVQKIGDELHFKVTIDDPVMYLRPWSYSYVADSRPDARMYEVHCLENVRRENNTNILYETLKPPPATFQ